MKEIVVEPVGEAWAVRLDGSEPQLFTRGSLAEDAAKATAVRLANVGEHVEIHIMLRDGRRGARFVCLPPLTDADRPLLVGGTIARPWADASSAQRDVPGNPEPSGSLGSDGFTDRGFSLV